MVIYHNRNPEIPNLANSLRASCVSHVRKDLFTILLCSSFFLLILSQHLIFASASSADKNRFHSSYCLALPRKNRTNCRKTIMPIPNNNFAIEIAHHIAGVLLHLIFDDISEMLSYFISSLHNSLNCLHLFLPTCIDRCVRIQPCHENSAETSAAWRRVNVNQWYIHCCHVCEKPALAEQKFCRVEQHSMHVWEVRMVNCVSQLQ